MRRRRRRSHKGTENVDRWLVTYADLITLLLAFFVMMYAISQVDAAKFEFIARSLAVQFTSDPSIIELGERAHIAPHPPEKEGLDLSQLDHRESEGEKGEGDGSSKRDEELDALYAKIKRYVVENQLESDIQVVNARRGVEITFAEHILFDLGRAELKKSSEHVLEPLVPLLNELTNTISIEGHTDDLPIVSGRFESNWELSTARARSVLNFLERTGIDPARMVIVGYGEYRPVKPNDSADNRQLNRRVNLVILR